MSLVFPKDFDAMAKEPAKPGGGSPLQISASALMADFSYAALDAEDSWITNGTAPGGYASRKLNLPAVESAGTFVLGCIDGVVQWIATESC